MITPWLVYGQTALSPNQVLVNPPCSVNGVMGEASLPYTVPIGKILILRRIGLEPLWGAAIIPMINNLGTSSAACLLTYVGGPALTSATGTPPVIGTQVWECEYYLPAGVVLDVRLSANWNPGGGWVYGWELNGELIDAPVV